MFKIADHQELSLSKMAVGSVLVGGVGSGKSITALEFVRRNFPGKTIRVITTAKKRDSGEWFEDAMKMSLPNHLEVDSWNNIANYVDEDAFFIFDEQKTVGKGAWSEAFIRIARRGSPWILLTATPADAWVDLRTVFIAHGFFRNVTEFNDAHIRWGRFAKYPKIDGYYDVHILEHYRSKIFVEMPFEKKAVRNEHIIPVEFDKAQQDMLYVERWNYEEDAPLKDAGEMMRLMRKSTNSHPSRLEKLKEIIEHTPRVIVYYNHNYELEILRTLHCELDISIAEWNGQLHQPIPDADRWLYIVQYQAGAEGWNCVSTDTVVFYSLPYSYRQLEQAMGRIDRLNTTFEDLHYYTLISTSIIDRAIWRALHRKKNFQASAFAKKTWPTVQSKTPLN